MGRKVEKESEVKMEFSLRGGDNLDIQERLEFGYSGLWSLKF